MRRFNVTLQVASGQVAIAVAEANSFANTPDKLNVGKQVNVVADVEGNDVSGDVGGNLNAFWQTLNRRDTHITFYTPVNIMNNSLMLLSIQSAKAAPGLRIILYARVLIQCGIRTWRLAVFFISPFARCIKVN